MIVLNLTKLNNAFTADSQLPWIVLGGLSKPLIFCWFLLPLHALVDFSFLLKTQMRTLGLFVD